MDATQAEPSASGNGPVPSAPSEAVPPAPRAECSAWVPARSEVLAEPPELADRDHCSAWVPAPWEVMVKNFLAATAKNPSDWQVQPGVNALQLGKDTVVLAPTGSGKTFPQVMPAFLHTGVSVIILMPLNELEKLQIIAQHVKKFRKWGLKAYVLNQQTKTPELMKIIRERDFQVLCTSPEQMDLNSGLRSFARDPKWAKDLVIVVDEAHCIPRWKDSFRKTYASIGAFRAYLPHHVPFIACTATATPKDVRTICETLQLGADVDIINLGNHRPNLIWEVRTMKGAAQSVDEVDFMVPKGITKAEDLEQQLLFCNERGQTHRLAHRLMQRLPENLRHTVEIYHSLRTVRQRAWTMYRFERGETRIIVCSEAIAMGCDFQNVTRVVQFMITDSLTTWIQRGGRGGRNPALTCHCIMLVQPSVFQLVKPRKKRKKKKATFEVFDRGPVPDGASTGSGLAHSTTLAELEAAAALRDRDDQDDAALDDGNALEESANEVDEEDDEIQLVRVEVEVEVDVEEAVGDTTGNSRGSSSASTSTPTTTPPINANANANAKRKKKVKKTELQARVFAKKVERDLRNFVSTEDCRGKVIDTSYLNPEHDEPPAGCCDLCIARKAAQEPQPQDATEAELPTPSAPGERDMDTNAPEMRPAANQDDPLNAQPPGPARKEAGTGDRRGDMLDAARSTILSWRYTTWKRDMRRSLLGEQAVMSDADVQIISRRRDVRDTQSLREAVPAWGLHEKYGPALLSKLREILDSEDAARVAAQRERDEARTAAQRVRDEARQQEQEERRLAREAARRPSKKEQRQAERDALIQAGKTPRGRPTRVELDRRAALAMGHIPPVVSPAPSTPLRASAASTHVPSSSTMQPLASPSHSPFMPRTPLPNPIPRTPLPTVLQPPPASHGLVNPAPLAFSLASAVSDGNGGSSALRRRGAPSNYVVSPITVPTAHVLTDLNGRKRARLDEESGTPVPKRRKV